METQTSQAIQTTELNTEVKTVETVATESVGEGEVEQETTTVAVEPKAEEKTEDTSSLVPAVLAVVVAVVGLIAAVKKLKSK